MPFTKPTTRVSNLGGLAILMVVFLGGMCTACAPHLAWIEEDGGVKRVFYRTDSGAIMAAKECEPHHCETAPSSPGMKPLYTRCFWTPAGMLCV